MFTNVKKLFKSKVVKAASWYTISDFFLKGMSFLTIPIFTRVLTTSDYGILSLYNTWVGIFNILLGLGTVVSVNRAKIDFKEAYNQFVSSVSFLLLLLFVVFIIIIFMFNSFFSGFIGLPKYLLYFLIVQSYFMVVKSFLTAKFQFEYKYKLISIISVIVSLLGLIISIYLMLYVFKENKYNGPILGRGVCFIISGILFLIYIFHKGKEFINFKYWKYSLVLGFPIIFHSLSHAVNGQFDRIIINKYIGLNSTGIYSFAYNIGMIVTVFLGSFNTAWVPWFFEKLEQNNFNLIKSKANNYRNIFTFIYALILFLSPEIIKIMADKSYWEGLKIIPWIFMACYFQFMYTLEVNVEFFLKKNNFIAIGTVLSAAMNIILNIIFIPKYGYIAAAITTAISYFFLFVFHTIITNLILKKVIYGVRFHMISIFYVFSITILFLIFQNLLYMRLIVIFLITILMVFKLYKYKDF